MLIVKPQDENLRLDKFLCKKFDISFGLAQKLIRGKKVKLNGEKCDASYKIQVQDEIEILSDLKPRFEKEKVRISDEKFKKFAKSIIFEDENLIAIDKPSSLAVQGGSGIEISVDDFVRSKNYQLVHRLDKDTSGILLIAKNKNCAEILTEKFKNKKIKKTYFALVDGNLKKEFMEINIPILKKNNGKFEKVLPDFQNGKTAISQLKLIKNFDDFALVELSPLTGRTHQLRVHTKEIGHAIINDFKYGSHKVMRKDLCKRLCLHAFKIEISDFFNKKLIIKTKLPEFYPNF